MVCGAKGRIIFEESIFWKCLAEEICRHVEERHYENWLLNLIAYLGYIFPKHWTCTGYHELLGRITPGLSCCLGLPCRSKPQSLLVSLSCFLGTQMNGWAGKGSTDSQVCACTLSVPQFIPGCLKTYFPDVLGCNTRISVPFVGI